jgi:L-3-cyanoalanine synthase/cysteine synthase
MAAIRSLLKKSSSSIPVCNELMMARRLFSAEAATVASASFAQRLRDLPKDLPGTKIKTRVSQVCPTPFFSLDR